MIRELLLTNKEKTTEIFNYYMNEHPAMAKILVRNFQFKRIDKVYYQKNKLVSLSGTEQKKLKEEAVCFIDLMYHLVEFEEGVSQYLETKEEKLLFIHTIIERIETE